jgi:hypothetical protein
MKNSPAGNAQVALLIAVSAIVVALIALMLVMKQNPDSMKGSGADTLPNPTGQVEGTAPTAPATSGSTTPAGTKNLDLSYTEALNLFGGYRFQFSDCSGTPGTLNLTKGATFLLDNRDAVAHTIKVGTQSYSVGAYGYRIASASTKGANQITCDGKGAAMLNVQ